MARLNHYTLRNARPLLKLTPRYPTERRDRKAIMAFGRQAEGLGRGVLVFTASPATGGGSGSALRATGDGPAFRRGAHLGGCHWQLPAEAGPHRPYIPPATAVAVKS